MSHLPAPEQPRLADFHHLLSLQAGAYQNGTWVVAASNVGVEDGVEQLGGPAIVAPFGEARAVSYTLGEELVAGSTDYPSRLPDVWALRPS